MLVDAPESPASSRFMRINGLRPSRGVECQYIMESGELNEKTEAARFGSRRAWRGDGLGMADDSGGGDLIVESRPVSCDHIIVV